MDAKKKLLCVALAGVTVLGFWHEAVEPADCRYPHTHQEAPACDTFRLPPATIVASGTYSASYGRPSESGW